MNKLKLFAMVGVLLTMFSCKKSYLDLDPVTNYTYYNFPKTEAQAEQSVIAMYRQLIPIYGNYMWAFGDMLSDNTSYRMHPTSTANEKIERLDEFTTDASEETVSNAYRDFYEGVLRSNFVLESLPNVTYASDSVKNIRVGEAKFLRAFHYFYLTQLYGDVPLVPTVITTVSGQSATNYPRKPVAEIIDNFVLPDLLDAVAKLPNVVPNSQKGRLTKHAAYMLLGKIYLVKKNYMLALDYFNLVNGYSLNASYAANFTPITKNGVESIFEIQVLPLPTSAGGYFFGFMNRWAPWGTGTTFWAGNSTITGGLNQPTNDLDAAYETNDVRKAATIARSGTGAATILCFKKFAYSAPANVNVNEAQWPVFRFAETLLARAECLNELSFPNATAFTLLNQVRTRAGLPNKTQNNANPALAINSQDDFRLAIEKERRVEFAGEAHRWFDLLRTNRAVPVMTAHAIAERAIKPALRIDAYTKIKTLIGIPLREIQQFGYTQNPDW